MKFGLDSIADERRKGMLREILGALKSRYGERLVSVALFGSVARGEADRGSDMDLIVVCEGFPSGLSDRMAELVEVLTQAEESVAFKSAREAGMCTWVQFHPLTPAEAELSRPLYLDVVEDGVLLHDLRGFLKRVLERLELKLRELGARRIFLKDGSWYWDLKPDLKFGEVVEI